MARLKAAIDENLPVCIPHTLNGWCRRYDHLRTERKDDSDDEALVFALTGHYTEDIGGVTMKARAQLDFTDRALRPSLGIHQISDIDSVIGIITDEFPIQDDAVFEYHLINDVNYCLKSDLHIPGWLDTSTQGNTNELLPYHKIPHAVFGTMNKGRTVIRIFFPEAREEMGDSTFLTEKQLEPFFNEVVKPAASETVSDHYIRTWPPTYEAELTRAKGRNGRPQFSGKALRGKHVRALVPKMRELAVNNANVAFCRNWFWMVEIKGVKAYTTHEPPTGNTINEDGTLVDIENDPRTLTLPKILGDWEFAAFESNNWYLDIATTISLTREDHTPVSALIRKDAHAEMIRYFTKEPIERCIRWTSNNSGRNYQFDETAHLGAVGGFRLTIRDREDKHIRYFQAYTTEKSLVYHPDGASVAVNSSTRKVLDDWEGEKGRFFTPTTETFRAAAGNDTTSHIAVRLESRVPFDEYPFVHHQIPDLNIQTWLYYLDTRTVWGFKGRRMSAITYILDKIMVNRSLIRWTHMAEVGSLVVLLVWMANALANRPASGGTWDVVKDAGSVHQLNDEGEAVPCWPLVYYALHSLHKTPVPRLSSLRTIDLLTIRRLNSTRTCRLTEADFFLMLNPMRLQQDQVPIDWDDTPLVVSTASYQSSSSNKRRRVDVIPAQPGPQVFGEGEGQIAIPGLNEVDDPEYPSEDEDPERRNGKAVTYEALSNLVHQVAVQVFAKAPNHTGSGRSYCLLDAVEKLDVTNDIFGSRGTLGTTWRAYTLFTDPAKWDNTVKRLFPTRAEYLAMTVDSKGNKVAWQGLSTMTFWLSWQVMLTQANPTVAQRIVDSVRNHINTTWRWFPAIEGGKLWNTAKKPKQQHFGDLENGPWIACNPRFRQ